MRLHFSHLCSVFSCCPFLRVCLYFHTVFIISSRRAHKSTISFYRKEETSARRLGESKVSTSYMHVSGFFCFIAHSLQLLKHESSLVIPGVSYFLFFLVGGNPILASEGIRHLFWKRVISGALCFSLEQS